MKLIIFMVLGLLTLCVTGCSEIASAETVDFEKLCTAIYKAEGAEMAVHKYGIMQSYKHTTPRQACLNTIKHAFKDWSKLPQATRKPYLAFLGERYCPTGGNGLRPAERALNRFWVKNVTYIYTGGAA